MSRTRESRESLLWGVYINAYDRREFAAAHPDNINGINLAEHSYSAAAKAAQDGGIPGILIGQATRQGESDFLNGKPAQQPSEFSASIRR